MEVIEISSSDEEGPSKKSKRSLYPSIPEVIIVSSPSDREDSPSETVSADGIKSVTLRISTSRLNRLREFTKKNLGGRARGTYRRNDRASVNNGHLSCDSRIISSSDEGEICSLPSMFCRAELETEQIKHDKGTPVKAEVKLSDIRQSPLKDPDDRQSPPKDSEFGQSPQRDSIYRQSPLHELLKETSKAVYNRSPAKRNLFYYQKMQKSPVKSLFSSPKLKQATITMESFSPKRICQPSRGQASPVPVVPPQHTIPVDLSPPNSGAPFFTEAQLIILECLLEEEVLQVSFLNTVMSFTSQSRKPTPELVRNMLQKILLSSRKAALSFNCYRSLKIIQALHPDVTAHAIEDLRWDFVQEIVEQLDLWRCSDDEQPCDGVNGMAAQNATLALAFVVSVLEDDLKQKQNARRSKVFRMLSTTNCLQNVEKVVEWIRVEVQHYCRGPAWHQDSCVVPISPGCCQDVLGLLQRLLQLSIDVSDMPIDSARRVTNGPLILAYMHPSISSIECKTLLMESLKSPLLRSTFIDLIFQNYCQDMGNPYHCGLQRIVRTYFLYMPPSYTVEASSACRSQSECEEFVMLLAFLMQSYIFCNTGCCQTNPSLEIHLSLEEVETLQHIERDVRKLQERLETLCNPLSEKAYGFLNLMISLQMFAE